MRSRIKRGRLLLVALMFAGLCGLTFADEYEFWLSPLTSSGNLEAYYKIDPIGDTPPPIDDPELIFIESAAFQCHGQAQFDLLDTGGGPEYDELKILGVSAQNTNAISLWISIYDEITFGGWAWGHLTMPPENVDMTVLPDAEFYGIDPGDGSFDVPHDIEYYIDTINIAIYLAGNGAEPLPPEDCGPPILELPYSDVGSFSEVVTWHGTVVDLDGEQDYYLDMYHDVLRITEWTSDLGMWLDLRFYTNVAGPVPEPSTYALMMGGAGLLFVVLRRKKKS